jgi:hypothetical protein
MRRVAFGAALILAVATSARSGTAADVDPLSLVPGSCNAVAVVKMRSLVNSPLGKRGKWFDEARRAYAEGLLSGPPWVKEIVQSTSVGARTRSQPLTYTIYVMDRPSFINDIARHELARVEKIAGHPAVMSPRKICFVQLAPGLVGAVQPADPQAVSEWLGSLDQKQSPQTPSSFLNALNGEGSPQVTIVVNLKGMLNSKYILNWIIGTPKLRATDDIEGLARTLSSLATARLSVHVSDAIVADLRLDFDAPINQHAKAIEKAVTQWLDDAGARPQVLAAAKTTVTANSLTFEVPLDEVGLRRLLSLVQSPHISPKEAQGKEGLKPNAVASAAYYDKVCDLLNSLLRKNGNATEYEKTALWHEKFASKIQGLSTTAVDPDLVRWGRDVSKELMALARSLRGESVRLDELERSIRSDETVQYQWYGESPNGPLYFPAWVTSDNNLDAVRSQQDSEVEKSASQRQAIWNMLYQGTGEIARKMEDTYHIKLKLPN